MKRLKNWSVMSNPFVAPELSRTVLSGNVYGHPRFEDGTNVNTSYITEVVDTGEYKEVHTASGSVYHIYPEDVDPEYEKIFPDAYNRFSIQYL